MASRGRLAGKKIPISPLIPLNHGPTLQKNQDYHLRYFENELLPRFNLTNTVPQLDLQILARDPILLQSVVAVANAHQTYAYRSPDEQASLVMIQDRNNALRMFRKHLIAAHDDEVNNSLFIANVLLCILDGIIEPSTDSLATHHHLVGGKAILKHWGGLNGIFDTKRALPILMLSIFATMDLTHALLIGDEPYFEADAWSKLGGYEAWWGTVNADDDFLETMAILSQLGTLAHGVLHLKATVPIDVLYSIQTALEDQATRQLEADDKDPERLAWAAFCSTYRFSASVILYRALSGLDVDHPLVQRAVTSCVEMVNGTALTLKLQHCILFPLLVVGTHCLRNEERAVIKRSIMHTSSYLSFESLRSLTSYLERRWTKLDDEQSGCLQMGWWEYFDEIAAATCLF